MSLQPQPRFARLLLKHTTWRVTEYLALSAQSERKMLSKNSLNTLENARELMQKPSQLKCKHLTITLKVLKNVKNYVLILALLKHVLARPINTNQTQRFV